jgi:hypothetical protein
VYPVVFSVVVVVRGVARVGYRGLIEIEMRMGTGHLPPSVLVVILVIFVKCTVAISCNDGATLSVYTDSRIMTGDLRRYNLRRIHVLQTSLSCACDGLVQGLNVRHSREQLELL